MGNQRDALLDWLVRKGPITQLVALRELGIGRLAARIQELKVLGYRIASEPIKILKANGDRATVAEYRIGHEQGKLFG